MGKGYAFIGFGEAGRTFAEGAANAAMSAFDIKTQSAETAAAMHSAYAACGVAGAEQLGEAISSASLIFSLVTAGEALSAAKAAGPFLSPNALFCDMNSVAPETKRRAATIIEDAGGQYADVAIMSPVRPKGLAAPLLVSGPHADEAAAALTGFGFLSVDVQPGAVGAASSVKMIRSVMVKGLEALTAECMLAAEAAGVREAVTDSLNASWPGTDWGAVSDYNLDRMLAHGLRRAEEMGEVVKTLNGLGLSADMSGATQRRQQVLGALGLTAPERLQAKLDLILSARKASAA